MQQKASKLKHTWILAPHQPTLVVFPDTVCWLGTAFPSCLERQILSFEAVLQMGAIGSFVKIGFLSVGVYYALRSTDGLFEFMDSRYQLLICKISSSPSLLHEDDVSSYAGERNALQMSN